MKKRELFLTTIAIASLFALIFYIFSTPGLSNYLKSRIKMVISSQTENRPASPTTQPPEKTLESPYDQFLSSYTLTSDSRFLKAAEITIGLYEKLASRDETNRRYSLGEITRNSDVITLPIMKDNRIFTSVSMPVDMSFAQALKGLNDILNAIDERTIQIKPFPRQGSYESGNFQSSLNRINKMDPRSIVEGLLTIEELSRNVGVTPELLLSAAKGYSLLALVSTSDKMQYADSFSAWALGFLALSKHLAPETSSLREEALISMNMGYNAHAQTLYNKPQPAATLDDEILDAYLKKNIPRLEAIKKETSSNLTNYFLCRLYREAGLKKEARQEAMVIIKRSIDHYPSVAELIYSGDFRLARILSKLYPADILIRLKYKIRSPDLATEQDITTHLKILAGEIPMPNKVSLAEFDTLLSNWQPLQPDMTDGIFIDSTRAKKVYRSLYSGAVYLRYNLLLNRLGAIESSRNFVTAMFEGNENHPLAMIMAAEMSAEEGDYPKAKQICSQIVKHDNTSAAIAMNAFFCVDDMKFRLKIAPAVFNYLDSRPLNLNRAGDLFSWLYNYDQAKAFYERGLIRDPYNLRAYCALSDIMKTDEYITKGLDRFGHNFSFLEYAADHFRNLNTRQAQEKALVLYDKAISLAPTRQPLWQKKSELLKQQGRYEDAISTLIEWIRKYGSDDLPTTIMKSGLASLYLKQSRPELALEALKDDLNSYQAGAIITLAKTYEAIKRPEDAQAMYLKAMNRYPTVPWVFSASAAYHWRRGQYDEAARLIAKGRNFTSPFSPWYFDDYMDVFADAEATEIKASFEALVVQGATLWEKKALAFKFQAHGRPQVYFQLIADISTTNRMLQFELKIDQYKALCRLNQEEAAEAFLKPYLSPQPYGPFVMVLFKEGFYDHMLRHITDIDRYPQQYREFMWLMKLTAWLAADKPEKYAFELDRHYSRNSGDSYFSIGQYLMEKISLNDLLVLIKTDKQKCEFAYYIGFGLRIKQEYAKAANWYQICLETGLSNNGEYHWASDEMFWWAHMGTEHRHKFPVDDVKAYHEREAKTEHL